MSEGHFEQLDRQECIRLLQGQPIGRLAFQGPDGLSVVPLAHTLGEGVLLLRTAEGTQLAGLPEGIDVAYEVDEFDAEWRNGWSVLVRGSLRRADAGQVADAALPEPFVPGERSMVLSVDLGRVSGRAVSASE